MNCYNNSNCNKFGEFKLLVRAGINHVTYSAYIDNNLWYHYLTSNVQHHTASDMTSATIKSLADGATHELWHHSLGHPGKTVIEIIHDYMDDVPMLCQNQLYNFHACMKGKFTKVPIGIMQIQNLNSYWNNLNHLFKPKSKNSFSKNPSYLLHLTKNMALDSIFVVSNCETKYMLC